MSHHHDMSSRTAFALHEYEGTPLYEALKAGIADLIRNQDIILTTPHEKVVGYLTKKVIEVHTHAHHDHRRAM
jgi:hypothetical protein